MALKRKSGAIEEDFPELLYDSSAVLSVEGGGMLSTSAHTDTSTVPSTKRRKIASSKSPAIPALPTSTKKRSLPASKASNLRLSTPVSRAPALAIPPPARAQPRSSFLSVYNYDIDEARDLIQSTAGYSAAAAIDGPFLDNSMQRLESPAYTDLSRLEASNGTNDSSSWHARHEDMTVPTFPAANQREIHPHAELVLSLTNEISKLEEQVAHAEAAKKAFVDLSKKMQQENAALKKNRAQLMDWMKQHAPNVALPPELVELDASSTSSSTGATSRHSVTTSQDLADENSSTLRAIDPRQDEAQPLACPAMPLPLTAAHILDSGASQQLSPAEHQHQHAVLQGQMQKPRKTIHTLNKETTGLKKSTQARKKLSKTGQEAEVVALCKKIEKLENTQGVLSDALVEFARLERYLTAICSRYESFVTKLEKTKKLPGVLAAAKDWIANDPKGHEGRFVDEDVAARYPTSSPYWPTAAGHQGPHDVMMIGAIDPNLSSISGRNGSFATTDSGFVEGENMLPPTTATPINHFEGQTGIPQSVPPTCFPAPSYTVDGGTSPQDVLNTNSQCGRSSRSRPQSVVFEDDQANGASPYMNNIHESGNFGLHLNPIPNAGNYHGHGTLAGVGDCFDIRPNSAPVATFNGSFATLNAPMTSSIPLLPTAHLPTITGPPHAMVEEQSFCQPADNVQSRSSLHQVGQHHSAYGNSTTCNDFHALTLPFMTDSSNSAIETFNKENNEWTQQLDEEFQWECNPLIDDDDGAEQARDSAYPELRSS